MLQSLNIKHYLPSLLYVVCVGMLLSYERSSLELQAFYALSFGLYLALFFAKTPWRVLLVLAVVLRLLCFIKMPFLSDDFYRFYWDGYLSYHGVSPYALTPTDALKVLPHSALPEIYPLLNSSHYFSVYTPLNQVFFALPFYLGVDSLKDFVLSYRLVFLLLEIGLFYVLFKKLNTTRYLLLFFALNPLLILETYNGLHIEFLMAYLLLLALSAITTQGKTIGVVLSAATKLITILAIPFLFWEGKKWFRNSVRIGLVGLLSLFLITFPFLISNSGFFTSLNLYFQSFEFNASIYFIIKEIGILLLGYNPIATVGGFILPSAFVLIYILVFVGFVKKKVDVFSALLLVFLSYYFLSTTVHPWYVIIPFSLFVFRPNFTSLIWTFTVFFSYQYYNTQTSFVYWNIAEYSLVLIGVCLDLRGTRMKLDDGRLKIISV